MNKIIRTLTFNDEVSLIAVDTTDMVNEAIRIHNLSSCAAVVLGKILTAVTYMSCWLKDGTGEISASIKSNGAGGVINVSGDSSLRIRGVIANKSVHCTEREVIGNEGYMTVIRDDAYSQPFVGTVPVSSGDVEHIFMEYYLVSEQLPTSIKLDVNIGEDGKCAAAGGLFFQALPSASFESKSKLVELTRKTSFSALNAKEEGLENYIKKNFDAKVLDERNAEYKCRCSREYIEGFLRAMHENELYEIVQKDGKVNVHCDYCNTDYDFDKEDLDKIFAVEKQ